MDYEITHQLGRKLSKTEVSGRTTFVEYRLLGDCLNTIRIIVPRPIERRGTTVALVETIYDFVLANGMKPKATCSYIMRWFGRYPEMDADSRTNKG